MRHSLWVMHIMWFKNTFNFKFAQVQESVPTEACLSRALTESSFCLFAAFDALESWLSRISKASQISWVSMLGCFGALMNSCCRSSEAEARSSGFFTRHRDTKSMNSEDQRSGSRKDGGGLVGIMKIARIGWMSPYGGFPSAISRAVIPTMGLSLSVPWLHNTYNSANVPKVLKGDNILASF